MRPRLEHTKLTENILKKEHFHNQLFGDWIAIEHGTNILWTVNIVTPYIVSSFVRYREENIVDSVLSDGIWHGPNTSDGRAIATTWTIQIIGWNWQKLKGSRRNHKHKHTDYLSISIVSCKQWRRRSCNHKYTKNNANRGHGPRFVHFSMVLIGECSYYVWCSWRWSRRTCWAANKTCIVPQSFAHIFSIRRCLIRPRKKSNNKNTNRMYVKLRFWPINMIYPNHTHTQTPRTNLEY